MAATKGKSQSTPKKPQKTAKTDKKVASDEPKNQRKRPVNAFIPTQEQRQIVMLAMAMGYDMKRLKPLIINPNTGKPASNSTITSVFAKELACGRDLVMAKISGTLVSIATDKQHKACVTAGIFLSKVWGKFREPEPEWSEKRRADAARDDALEQGDIHITARLVLEEPKELPAPGAK